MDGTISRRHKLGSRFAHVVHFTSAFYTSAATAVVAPALPGEPQHVRVFPHNSDALDVSWEAPASDGGSPVTGYTVQWKQAADSWDTAEDVSEETVTGTTHTITGLTQGVEYNVRVIAVNTVGDGPSSVEATGTPRETVPPELLTASVDGKTLTLTFDEALDENSTPATTTFEVTVGDEGRGLDGVSVSDRVVTLNLASAVASGHTVTVSYDAPSEESAARIRDLAGNAAPSFSGQTVTNDASEATEDPGALWSATMTVGLQDDQYGYSFIGPLGQLSETSFSLDGSDYTVKALIRHEDKVGMSLNQAMSSAFLLRAGSAEFASEDASTQDVSKLYIYFWPRGEISWAEGEQVAVSLVLAEEEEQPSAAENNPATGAPTISGTAKGGQTLTADTSGITDADGLPNVSYGYQWLADDAEMEGATESTYTLTDAEVGKTIKIQVSFTDDASTEETITSAATGAVAATVPGQPEHLRVVPHDAQGLDLSWEAPASDGGSPVTGYKVQWKQANGNWDTAEDVSEETGTGTTYTINGLTEGVEYTVRVVAVNDVGDGAPAADATGTPKETVPPQFETPEVDGAALTLTYDEALDQHSAPGTTAFRVTVEKVERTVDRVSVSGSTVVLTLASAVAKGETVVVSYTPSSDEEAPRIRDLAGNPAAGFDSTEGLCCMNIGST